MDFNVIEIHLIQAALIHYSKLLESNPYNVKGGGLSGEVKRLAEKIDREWNKTGETINGINER